MPTHCMHSSLRLTLTTVIWCAAAVFAQSPARNATAVPRLVKYSGTLVDSGSKPLTGTLGATFSLYAESEGGAPIWMENQNVEADANGQFTVLLGFTRNDGIPVEAFGGGQRWLGIRVQGEAERPRVLIASVPYSLKAVDAETLGGLPASAFALAGSGSHGAAAELAGAPGAPAPRDAKISGTGTADYIAIWKTASTLGNSKLYQTAGGNVGVGTTAPAATLEAVSAGATGIAVMGSASSATGANFGVNGTSASTSGTGVFGQATAASGTTYGVQGTSGSAGGTGVLGSNVNGVGVEGITGSATAGLAGVAGSATAASGSAYGVYGLAAGATGVGVVGSASSTTGGNFGVYGDVVSPNGIGVEGSATQGTGVAGVTAGAAGYGVYGANSATSGNAFGVYGTTSSPAGSAVFGNNLAATGTAYGVNAQTASTAGIAVRGVATATSGANFGLYGAVESAAGIAVEGAGGPGTGVAGTSSNGAGYGVYGANSATTGSASGVYGASSSTVGVGVTGVALSTSGANRGLYGNTLSPGGTGVSANATGGGTALVATATGAGTAGLFNGNVKVTGNLTVTGTVSKGGGAFRIDHPLDPEHKYLYHSFVESPDMMNIYNGVVTLSRRGDAVVKLPEWFDALNRDFRYQLTCIGGFAPVYIAREVSGNEFKIAGGKAGMKVSWQVTGIRQDTFANEHRIPLEENKADAQ